MFYEWTSAWIHPLLGLLATASGVVVVVHLLGWRVLRWRTWQLWVALYVASAVALGAARFAFPIETQGPATLLDAIPLMVVPVTIAMLYLLLLVLAVGLWSAVYSVLALLGVHIVFSIIARLRVLTPTLPHPSLPELAVFSAFAVLALSRWNRRVSQAVSEAVAVARSALALSRWTRQMARVSQNLDHSLARAVAVAEERHYSRATLEHLLLALTEDPDAIPVLQACHVDIETLRRAISSSLVIQGTGPDGALTRPHAHTPAVVRRAAKRVLASRQTGTGARSPPIGAAGIVVRRVGQKLVERNEQPNSAIALTRRA